MTNSSSKLTLRNKKIDSNFTSLSSLANWYQSYWMDEYRDKVFNIITELWTDKDDILFLEKIYQDISFDESDLSKLSIDDFKDKIMDIVDNQVIDGNKDFFTKFAKYLLSLWAKTVDIDKIDPLSLKFSMLTHFSKKKALVYKLLKEFPNEWTTEEKAINKKNRKDKIVTSKKVWEADGMYESLDAILNSNKDVRFYQMLDNIFWDSVYSWNQDVIEMYNWEYRWAEKDHFINMLKSSNVSEDFIQKFLDEDLLESNIIDVEKKLDISTEKSDKMIWFESVSRKNVSDFNPLLMDLSLATWLKIFSFERFKDIYKNTFAKISGDIIDANSWVKPNLNSIFKVDTNFFIKKEDKDKKEQKNSIVYQYLLEWEVWDDFSAENLKDIATLMNSLTDDVNLNSLMDFKRFSHPIQTSNEALDYRWYFDESGSWFEWDYIIETKDSNKDKSQKKLRLCLAEYTQDSYIYLMTQIGYYLKHKTFLDEQQLYANMFYKYTEQMVAWEKVHDITIMEEKYDNFMKKIIIPLSLEWKDLGIKPENTVFTWPYGTWKSQFLLNLLSQREFKFKGKNFHLNANVIDINVWLFEWLLMNDFGWLRTKLDEIYQKSWLPIVLVIEDFETILNEKLHWVNDKVAQKLTTTLEWIGSLPVTIVTSTNNPTRIPERLIRPNRFSNIIDFFLPTDSEKKVILDNHLSDKWIKLSKKIKTTLFETRLFQKWTASHLAAFVVELRNIIDTWKIFWEDISLDLEIVVKVADNINISLNDLENIIEVQKWWLKDIKWHDAMNWIMWFKA